MDECKPYIDSVIVVQYTTPRAHTHTHTEHTNTNATRTNILDVIHWNFIAICSLSFAHRPEHTRIHIDRHTLARNTHVHSNSENRSLSPFHHSREYTVSVVFARTLIAVHISGCIISSVLCDSVLMLNANAHDEYNVCIYGSCARFLVLLCCRWFCYCHHHRTDDELRFVSLCRPFCFPLAPVYYCSCSCGGGCAVRDSTLFQNQFNFTQFKYLRNKASQVDLYNLAKVTGIWKQKEYKKSKLCDWNRKYVDSKQR